MHNKLYICTCIYLLFCFKPLCSSTVRTCRLGPTSQSTTSHHREGNSKIDSLKSPEHKFSAFRIISRIITFYEAGGSSPVSKHGCGRHESFEGFRTMGGRVGSLEQTYTCQHTLNMSTVYLCTACSDKWQCDRFVHMTYAHRCTQYIFQTYIDMRQCIVNSSNWSPLSSFMEGGIIGLSKGMETLPPV